MACKVVFFYNQDQSGWTETYYCPSTDPFTFLNSLPATLFQKAMAFRAAGTDLYAVRATLLGGLRQSFTLPLQGRYPSPFSVNSSAYNPDVVTTDALYNLYDGLGHVKKMYFRGLIDAWTNKLPTGQSVQYPDLIQAIGQFITQLYNNNFQLRYQNRPPTGGLLWNNVAQVNSASAEGYPQFTFCQTPAATGFVIGTPLPTVIFQNVNRNALPGFPLTTTVLAQTASSPFGIVIPYNWRGIPVFTPNKNMRFCLQTFTYQGIFSGQFLRLTEHKTGRPFGIARGRARSIVRSN